MSKSRYPGITRRPDGKSQARYRDNAGRQHSKIFELERDAVRWRREQLAALEHGEHVGPKAGRTTVGAMADAWLKANPDWTPSTWERHRGIVENYIRPRWGQVPLARATFEDIQSWVTELSHDGLAGATVQRVYGVLTAVLGFAVAAKRLAVNPTQGVKLPKRALTGRRYLPHVEVERLALASGEHWDIALVLAYTGLRIGEVAALRVRHVNMLRRRFRIEEAVTEVNGRLVWSSPKDHQRRSVPFPDFLAEAISRRLAGRGPGDLVFTAPRGGVLRVRNMRRDWFDRAAVEAGVAGLTPHELRHTAASLAVSAGASVLALQRMLGHDKPSTTLDVYADLFDDDLDAVADRLSDARAQIPVQFLCNEPAPALPLRGAANR